MVMQRKKLSTSLSLPTEVNELSTDFASQCALWFGRKSWGKSTLLSQYPGLLLMMLEPGRRNLPIAQIPKPGEKICWELIVEYTGLFIESDYTVIGYDTLDRLYAACLKFITSQMSGGEFDDPQQCEDDRSVPGFYVGTQKVFEEFLENIQANGKNFILTSHDKKVVSKHPITLEKEERIEPSCSGSAWKIAQSMCDYVFHLEFVNKQRVVTVRDLDNIALAACGRNDVFLDPDGKELSRFVIPNEASKVYETVLAAYNNELRDIAYEAPAKPLVTKGIKGGAKQLAEKLQRHPAKSISSPGKKKLLPKKK